MKGGLFPHPFVVARRGVENTPLALRAHPRPRLGFGDVVVFTLDFPHHQDRAILLIVVAVLVGLVPRLELFHAGHRRVIRIDHLCGEGAAFVALEPATDQLVEFRFVAEAPTGTVHRHESAAALDEALQIFPLPGLDLAMVRI